MKKNISVFLSLIVLASLVLAACTSTATATEMPAMTEAPAATEAPTATEAPAATEAPVAVNYEAVVTDTSYSAKSCDYGGEFKSIEAVDPSNVKFTLCYPDPAFLQKAAFAVFAIQDSDYLTQMGGDSAKMSEKPNGTGPYVLKEWVRGDHITFEANPDYWGTPPANKTLIFRWSAEAAQRLLELQAGTVDGIFAPSAEDYETIQNDTTLKLIPYQTGNVFYIGMNNTVKPFDNEKVRQAVAMAIDKKRIVDSFYPPNSYVAEQFVPSDFAPGFSSAGTGAKWYSFDVAGAKALFAEAGYPNGFDVTLGYRDVSRVYLPHVNQVAQDIQDQLKQIGVNITVNKMESGPFIESESKGEQTFFLLGWGMDYPDSTNFYDYHFASNAVRFGTEFPDIVKEVKAAAQVSDKAERQTHYDAANALIKQHVPLIPVAHGTTADAFKASVGNVIIGPLNENFAQMRNAGDQVVWMQSGEPISLWCGDESDGETLRACLQIYDSLLGYAFGGTAVTPALSDKWEANPDATEWTFHLRDGVKFSNGATLDAMDVVNSYAAQWDLANPNHKGNGGAFEYTSGFFGQFLNTIKK